MKALDVCLYEMTYFIIDFSQKGVLLDLFFAACIAKKSSFLYSNGPSL